MSRRVVTFGGLAAVGGATYYLYSAGGDPKLAEKKAEHDVTTAARKLKGDFPGQDKEAKKAGEEGYEAVRAKAQDLSARAKAEAEKATQKVDAYSQDAAKKFDEARREGSKKVEQFDKTVIEKSREAKGWFSSGWFGGGK